MKSSYTPARLAVLAGSCLLGTSASSQSVPVVLPETIVSAARIPEDPRLMPQGVVVITAEQIRAAGASTANEAIRWLGGVVGRIDTTGGRDPALDLRGFGEAASSNVVYLVDGVRQNEGDSGGGALSWIPVDSIERIEIVRGNGSVLYGEGATAGVINIITQQGLAEPGGQASFGVGSHATHDLRASVRTATGPWRFQVHASSYDTDNHRDNFARQERNALARATWVDGSSQWFLQAGAQSAKSGLPGGLTPADFQTNPRKSDKPQDHGKTEQRRLQLGGEFQTGDWRVALDLTHRKDNMSADYGADYGAGYVANQYHQEASTEASRASARAWRAFTIAGVTHRFLMGMDSEQWQQDRNKGDTRVNQSSDALFARHEVELKDMGLKAYVGARRTLSARQISGSAVGRSDINNTSWDSGLGLRVGETGEVFGRLGTSFRLPTADEFGCYPYPGGPTCPPVSLLKPQTSRDTELGYRQQLARGKWSARLYRSELVNEIGYDPNLGNTNFDPTRREGVELDGNTSVTKDLDLGAQWAQRRAVFREGVYAGRTVPMVPNHSLTTRLSYRMTATRTLWLGTQWVSSQRITDDFGNSCTDKIPSYAVSNLRLSEKFQDWLLSLNVNNLTDKHYFNYRTRCSLTAKSVYPEAGRTFLISAQRSF